MILTFLAADIEKQLSHARGASQHRAPESDTSAQASLHLERRAGRYSLVSNGWPRAETPAFAVSVDTSGEEERGGPDLADFVEPMRLDAFAKALTKSEVAIVVTRTYINVLGGQPARPLGLAPSQARR